MKDYHHSRKMDIKVEELWKFPVQSTSIHNGGVKVFYSGGDAWITFDFFDCRMVEFNRKIYRC